MKADSISRPYLTILTLIEKLEDSVAGILSTVAHFSLFPYLSEARVFLVFLSSC